MTGVRPIVSVVVPVKDGGPLLDEKGSVIGLTVMGLHPDETQSLNLFIPIDDALKALAVQPAA